METKNETDKEQVWYALDITLEADAHEAVDYALMEAGALGTEVTKESSDTIETVAYFGTVPDREQLRDTLFNALQIYSLPSSSVKDMQLRTIEAKDWLAEWKAGWRQIHIGERFIVAPPWDKINNDSDRIVIEIEPGMAFGTGTHETTRLCLLAIEKYFKGKSFLDVGTGTGILAIAAAKLYPEAPISACDIDPEAVQIARENAEINGVDQQIKFWVGSVGDQSISAECVCANLTADVIINILPDLVNSTCGRLILSGILKTQEELVVSSLQHAGIVQYRVETDGEWIAIIV
jgi:ribosomal protein L11 methyltransferase